MSVLRRAAATVRTGVRSIYREVAKFGIVGLVAFVVDAGGYNLLVFGLPGSDGGPMQVSPVAASVVATGAATFVSWAGNSYWTYRHQRRDNVAHELALFVAVNVMGIVITASTVFVSREVLGLGSVLADNTARLLGWGFATAFRFLTYRRYVYVRPEERVGVPGRSDRVSAQTLRSRRPTSPSKEPGA